MRFFQTFILALMVSSVSYLSAQTTATKQFNDGIVAFKYPANYVLSIKQDGEWMAITGNQTNAQSESSGNQFEFRYFKFAKDADINPTKINNGLFSLLDDQRTLYMLAYGEENVSEVEPYSDGEHKGYSISYIAKDKWNQQAVGVELIELYHRMLIQLGVWIEDREDTEALDNILTSVVVL